ncbi:LysE/ArgO family amino acid transporter [Reinekea thalattae]|uniref:Lysine transporter LysE n=1 Tax=Reinekea thalattae TaxID=2593301 RepID=A0A5C8ZAH7_9GAMM|nr:LysE family transporter [Reinekea thalattae]TXR54188.1 lysine transporter LysE [Reinekea thalattae]
MQVFWVGFSVSFGLIVAIGAQNAWVLGMSIRRHYPWLLATVCALIDSFLMATGTLFFHHLQQWLPNVVPWFTGLGIVLLLWLAFSAALRVWRGNSGLEASQTESISWQKALATVLLISLLNPHVYLDTVILVGSLASASSSPWLFWSGAASASTVWFFSLAAAGKPLKNFLKSPIRWRLFDGLICVVMCWAALGLWLGL